MGPSTGMASECLPSKEIGTKPMHFKMHSYPLVLSHLRRLKFHNSDAHNEMNKTFSGNHLLKSSTDLPTADNSAHFRSWKGPFPASASMPPT